MSWEIVSRQQSILNRSASFAAKKAIKQARERLDRLAEAERIGWLKVQQMGVRMFGKAKGYSIQECKILMERIKTNGTK